jgi:hypothetical protein
MAIGQKGTLDRSLVHPFLWAAQPLLFLYARAVHEFPPSRLLAPLAAAFAATAVVWALAYLILRRDALKSAFLTSALLVVFFSFGRAVDLADGFFEATGIWGYLDRLMLATRIAVLQAAALAVSGAVILALFLRLLRKKPLAARTTPLLATTALLLILFSLGRIFVGLISSPRSGPALPRAAGEVRPARNDLPDVYIIVVDGYARADVLRRFYGFDNARFLSDLEGLGFSIASKSSANYAWTFLSLASALNMTHLQGLAERAGPRSRDQKRAQEMVRDNAALAFLRTRGYRAIHIASPWEGTRSNPKADETLGGRGRVPGDEFSRALADSSLLSLFNSRLTGRMAEFYLRQFQNLEAAGAEPGPKMVFVHFLLPHHPFIFDRDGRVPGSGSFLDQLFSRRTQWREADAYIDQVIFLNERLLAVIRALLGSSGRPPVIVLFSDHGPLVPDPDPGTVKRARLANLTAACLPGAPKGLLPEDVSLVNVLPLVLNHYFGAGIDLQPPDRYYSLYARPYAFERLRPDPD